MPRETSISAPIFDTAHTPLPGRTRLNVKQSKNGCFTCKARHMKCDETRPTCLRCGRSGKICQGYKDQATTPLNQLGAETDHLAQSKPICLSQINEQDISLYTNLSHRRQIPFQEARSSRFGIEVFLQAYHEEALWDELPQWMRLLAQLLPVSDAVNGAMACFGSVCEAVLMPGAPLQPMSLVTLNQKALMALQIEILTLPYGPIPIFLASVVLAAAEILLRRMNNALMHIRGAFKSLDSVHGKRLHGAAPAKESALSTSAVGQSDELYALALSMDMQGAWYRLSDPPNLLQTFDLTRPSSSTDRLIDTDAKMLTFLHSCYHFTNRAAKFKYRILASLRPSLVLEQSRYIAVLLDWLEEYDPRPAPLDTRTKRPTKDALVLRVQCLSTLIYLSTILEPYQSVYDLYAEQFTQILDISEQILSAKKQLSCSSLPRFQVQTGLFQPLYFTAMKYRHPCQRRRAVALLEQVGIEGPWNAQMMAAIARRTIAIEEMAFDAVCLESRQATCIFEKQRIYGCGLVNQSIDLRTSQILVQAEFSMCNDIDSMLRAVDDEQQQYWTVWTEELQGQKYLPGSEK